MGIVVDSPIGRALARRLEGPREVPPGLDELARKVGPARGRSRRPQPQRAGAAGRERVPPAAAGRSPSRRHPATAPRLSARPAAAPAGGHGRRRESCSAESSAWSAIESSPTTSAPPTRPTRSTPRSGSPTSCRICSAKACSPPRSSRSMPACARAATASAKRPRVAAAVAALLAPHGVGARPGWASCSRRCSSRSSRRASRARSARRRPGWCGFCFPAPGCWCSRPGASACSTATAASSCPTSRRWSGTWRSSRRCVGFGDGSRAVSISPRSPPGAPWWAACCSSRCSYPTVLRLLGGSAPRPAARRAGAAVVGNFVPVFVGRGVVQISAYVDTVLASLLPTGAVAAVSYAQVLYTLPVSLFGMSVSAAELPEMASATGSDTERAGLSARQARGRASADRVLRGSRRSSAFLALGDVVAGALYQSGEFTEEHDGVRLGDPRGVVGGAAALHPGPALLLDLLRAPRHPNAAPDRDRPGVVSASALGYLLALQLPPALGIDARWGAAGITLGLGTRRAGGVPLPPPGPEPADRAHGAGPVSLPRGSGSRPSPWRRVAGPLALPPCIRSRRVHSASEPSERYSCGGTARLGVYLMRPPALRPGLRLGRRPVKFPLRMTAPTVFPTRCSASSTPCPKAPASTCGRTPAGTCSTSARPSGFGAGSGATSPPTSRPAPKPACCSG